MKKNHNIILFAILTITVSWITNVHAAAPMSDKLIKQQIEDKVADTFRLRGTKVNLAVEDGNVVLFGEVGLYIQKMIYEQIAWKTEGVIEVENEIRIVPRSPQTDAVIERKIMEVVQTHQRFLNTKIEVVVKNGAVNIRINLDHPSDVLFLKHRVAEIDGVISIDIQAKFFV